MVTMKEIELELCMMEIYDELMELMFLYDGEELDYAVEDGVAQFIVISEVETDEYVDEIVTTMSLVFEYDFELNDGNLGSELAEYLPMRLIYGLIDALKEIGESYLDYEEWV